MINNKILPAHILRLYLWEVLKLNTSIWGPDGINGLVPIAPLTDAPQLADSGKSYMIYGYSENNNVHGQIRSGSFALRVIGRTFAELGEITNIVTRAFEDCDMSAEAVNIWSSEFGGTDKPLVGIRFTKIEAPYIEGGDAAEAEGAPSEGLINISYEYITHQSITLPIGDDQGLWARNTL